MRRLVCLLLLALAANVAGAQSSLGQNQVITRQCAAIRELVYMAASERFESIRMDEIRGSSGHQTQGSWKFATTRFNTNLTWQGANTSYLEHYEESTDSTRNDTWQYIAEYSSVPTVLHAQQLFAALNNEIEGCIYPLNDSTDVAFVPLPANRLPADRPSSLEIAKLYELPLPGAKADTTQGAIMVMVGMEKRSKDYRVSLIVENSLR